MSRDWSLSLDYPVFTLHYSVASDVCAFTGGSTLELILEVLCTP